MPFLRLNVNVPSKFIIAHQRVSLHQQPWDKGFLSTFCSVVPEESLLKSVYCQLRLWLLTVLQGRVTHWNMVTAGQAGLDSSILVILRFPWKWAAENDWVNTDMKIASSNIKPGLKSADFIRQGWVCSIMSFLNWTRLDNLQLILLVGQNYVQSYQSEVDWWKRE